MEKENNITPKNEELNVVKYEENIKNLIYTIRGKQVMLDSDVAMLYHYETKKLNHPNALYIPPAAVLLILSVITALFIKFTFSPPHIPLFKDPLTYSYGLMQY